MSTRQAPLLYTANLNPTSSQELCNKPLPMPTGVLVCRGCVLQASVLFVVPPVATLLAKHPLVDTVDLSCVKVVLSGAAPLGKDIEDKMRQRIGQHIIIKQGRQNNLKKREYRQAVNDTSMGE